MGNIKQKKILYFVAEADYFCSHRLHIALAALKASYEVALIARCNTAVQQKLEALGITVFPLHHFKRGGFNPFHQIRSLLEIYRIYKHYKPDVVHQVALKPVIFGSWMASICGVPRVINALPGLGYLFTTSMTQLKPSPVTGEGGPAQRGVRVAGRCDVFCHPDQPSSGTACHLLPEWEKDNHHSNFIKTFTRKIVLRIFKNIFSAPNSMLILQNIDDQNYLIQQAALRPEQSVIIPGAGVDLDHYQVAPFPPAPPVRIVCMARLLWHKGLGELADAAKMLKARYNTGTRNHNTPIDIVLYGLPDPENPSSIPETTLQHWQAAGILRWEGHCEDVASAYASAHIAVLPSYREGLPKSLLEAASCGRPIVSTDVPGCRAVVQDGENGFLAPPQDPTALAQALARLIEDPILRTRMGLAGRKRVEQSFSERLVQEKTLVLYP